MSEQSITPTNFIPRSRALIAAKKPTSSGARGMLSPAMTARRSGASNASTATTLKRPASD
jgi:hypothetical protein